MPNKVTPYVPTNWQDLPTKTTPIDETNLNHMEQGITNLTDFVNNDLDTTVDVALSSSSEHPVQNKVITAEFNKTYKNTASTMGFVQSDAMFPVYQSPTASSPAVVANVSWSTIKSTLKTYFDTIYNKYVLPIASQNTLGGIKVGNNLAIDPLTGVLSAQASSPEMSYNETLTVLNTTPSPVPPLPNPIPTFENATDAQIAAIMANHYAGNIDIHDYWGIGDHRVVSGSSVYMVIVDEDKETLTTPEGEITNAAFSIALLPYMPNTMPIQNGNAVNTFDQTTLYSWLNDSNSGLINIFSNDMKPVFKEFEYGPSGHRYDCKFTIPLSSDYTSNTGISYFKRIFSTGEYNNTTERFIIDLLINGYGGQSKNVWCSDDSIFFDEEGEYNRIEQYDYELEDNTAYVYMDMMNDTGSYSDSKYIIPYCVI